MQILALVFAQGPRDVKSRASRAEKREDDLPNLYTKFDDLRNFLWADDEGIVFGIGQRLQYVERESRNCLFHTVDPRV